MLGMLRRLMLLSLLVLLDLRLDHIGADCAGDKTAYGAKSTAAEFVAQVAPLEG